MIAGSLFSAFTVGLAITLTLPWLANALSSPVKSLMFRPDGHRAAGGRRHVLRQRHRIAGALDKQLPVEAGRELVVQHDFDDLRLNLHLARRAILYSVEIELNLVEAIGKIGRLQQRGLPVHVESPLGRQQRLHAGREVAEDVAGIRVGHVRRAALAVRGCVRLHPGRADGAIAFDADSVRDPVRRVNDVVQIETARFESPLEDADQVSLHGVVVPVRLQNHLERLPQRDVFQLTSERPLHVGIGHDAEPGVANEHEQQVGDRRGLGQRDRDGPRAVEVAALLALVELRDGERAKRRLAHR